MKSLPSLICILQSFCFIVVGDDLTVSSPAASTSDAQIEISADGQTTIVKKILDRDVNTQIHETTSQTIVNGESKVVTNRFTLLQPGLNYFSKEEQIWKPTSLEIELAQIGATYRKAPFQLDFAPNSNDLLSAVALTLPDGRIVKIKTVGIALTDLNGDSVWLGEVRDSNGLLAGDTIIYPDAFNGVKADIVIKVSTGKYESDIVLREQILNPKEIGFDPSTTSLEIWHKIVDAPVPETATTQIVRQNGLIDTDHQLSFGDMFIGEGTAFLAGEKQSPLSSPDGAIRVSKDLYTDPESKAQYLIERIPYSEAIGDLQGLPARTQASFGRNRIRSRIQRNRDIAFRKDSSESVRRVLPVSAAESVRSVGVRKDRKLASISRGAIPKSPGFVMDYTVLLGISNFRFRGDTTYYCTNAVNITGSPIIEGGTVVKYPPYNGDSRINFYGKVTCLTSPYSMAYFTADADNSVGETVSTNALSGFYGRYNFYFASTDPYAQDLHDISTGYSYWGIVLYGTNSHNISNMRFMNCWYGIQALDTTVTLQNILSDGTVLMFYGSNVVYRAEHVTAHTGNNLFSASSGVGSLYLTNSLVVGMTYSSSGVTTDHVTTLASDSRVFQSVGAGAFYLPTGSPYRDSGNTALSTNMQAILRKTTTYAPVELSGTVSVPTTLSPQAQRDTDIPDLGYHYPPIDFLWGNLTIDNNTMLVLTNGVAIALHSTNATILNSGAQVISEGSPNNLNRLVRYKTVQEQPTIYGTIGTAATLFAIADAPSVKPEIHLRFTEVSVAGNLSTKRSLCSSSDGFNVIDIRNSHLVNLCDQYNPTSGSSTFSLTNNILERCDLTFTRSTNLHEMSVKFWNNYFKYSSLTLSFSGTNSSPPTWDVHDNLFDNVALTAVGSSPFIACSYNGYYATTAPSLSGGNDKTPGGLDFQSGPLGSYYYPSTNTPISTNLWVLVDAGSRAASDATLYHFTTRGDQIKDLSTVDIGFHYVATDSSGNPLDSDGDGIPDYREDSNGNGIYDTGAGESDYTSSPNGPTGVPWLTVFPPFDP
jgi:hypothetical protein